jgi:hypothetical protein
MFNLSTQDVVRSIEKAPLVILDGIHYQEYHDFFGVSVPKELTGIKNTDFHKLEKQFDRPRQRISYDTDIMKRLKVFFMRTAITTALEKKFRTALTFDSVDIWRDNAGYSLESHTDDDRIKLAIQIYLGDDNIGTSLYDSQGNIIKSFEYKLNSGYALLNNRFSLHGTTSKSTRGDRTSVYVRYR